MRQIVVHIVVFLSMTATQRNKRHTNTYWYLVNLRGGVERLSWTDYEGYHDELHNYEVIIHGVNIRHTRAKKHCRVGGRRAVSRSVWFGEDTTVTNSCTSSVYLIGNILMRFWDAQYRTTATTTAVLFLCSVGRAVTIIIITLAIRQCRMCSMSFLTWITHNFPERRKPRKQKQTHAPSLPPVRANFRLVYSICCIGSFLLITIYSRMHQNHR